MKHNEGTFQGDDGLSLYYQNWLPDQRPKAVLVLVHGFGEHSGRYPNIINHLVPQGFAIYSFDHRGHGRSAEQLLVHVDRWSQFHQDVEAFLELVREREPGLPLFLMGHSMGGLIVLGYTLDHPEGLQGVIASGPAVGEIGVSSILLLIGRILSRIMPKLGIDAGMDAEALSRDPAVARAYLEDPLVNSKATPRFSTEFSREIERVQAAASSYQCPLLILHGQADRLAFEEASRHFFEKVPHADKERILYDGGYHEPHNDIQHEQVTADIQRWLEAHL